MFPIQHPMSVETKASLEANLALYTALTNKTLESVEKLINLNISTVKASLDGASVAAKQIMAVRDPEEFMEVIREQSKPQMSKAIAYSGHVFGIAQSIQSEFSSAAESQFAAVTRKVNELVEQTVSKAPVGADTMMTVVKSAFGDTGNGFEQMTRTAKHAMEVLESNLNSAMSHFAPAHA